ncbi:HD-GYP domain-containing protein [Conexibacter sp. SYSU D00693]|uniref:HD-GYP domain-containing protein n=1 Tax=Conexibacter sp. SYSU D00693 TaxID=2812560 RepID=UPI00196B3D20|nr:HD-GYP domain-containing protein [Conexibacter sp. SYSU D00693]
MSGSSLNHADELLFEEATRRERAAVHARELRVQLLAAAAFLVLAVALAVAEGGQRDLDLGLAAALVAAIALLHQVLLPVGHGFAVPTQLALVPALFVLPPAVVPLVVALGAVLGQVPRHVRGERHPERALLSLSDATYALGPALVLVLAGAPEPAWSDWPLYAAALAAQVGVDFLAAAWQNAMRLEVPAREQLRLMSDVWWVDLALSPIGLLAAMQHEWAFLVALPVAALLRRLASERDARMAQAVELSNAYRGTALLLGDVIEEDDAYTGEHSRGVVALSLAVADELRVGAHERRLVELGALMHDVGKLAIPKEIVNKPGALDDEEWAIMRTHTVEGQRMLDRVGGVLQEVGVVVRGSHERWDGGGYPDGLMGDAIPLAARVVCVADAFNAMTTDRPYRRARSTEVALAELRACAGTQFDPAVVTATEAVLRRHPDGVLPAAEAR